MIDLLHPLIDATKTIHLKMGQWFSAYPAGMPWTVVSDYCIGDEGKPNDVFSFVAIANHDSTANICEYITAVAPRDLKKVNEVPVGLIQYLTCPMPVTFSVSFVINRQSQLLRDYLRAEDMASFIPDAREFVQALKTNTPVSKSVAPEYFDDVLKRLALFERNLARKQPNDRLARQIHLTSAFAATLFFLITGATQASYLRWISDRDKLIEHSETVVYDLAYLYFILMRSKASESVANIDGTAAHQVPEITFEIPDKVGKYRFDELIRLPDYLAGTLADLSLDNMSSSREKFETVLHQVFVDSPNNWVVILNSDSEKITVKGAQFQG
ncbi:hypothetical protein ACO0K9_13095 [Undibacterium sp. Ji50W]|uniref:hypothetical protein n=1 Tax=Undibacterium sp. Ji50W TaxID=3413041 RepID=UPI003BF41A2E